MLTQYRKWAKKRGTQNYNIIHVADPDPGFVYFYLEDRPKDVRIPFKLGVTLGSLNGLAVSDFDGNCQSTLTCDWADEFAAYASSNYSRGLIVLLTEAIAIYRRLSASRRGPEKVARTRKKILIPGLQERIRNLLITPTSLGVIGRRLTDHKIRFNVKTEEGNIEVLVTLTGLDEQKCPVFSVITPRVALGGNVSFGGIIEFAGLTPLTWRGNLNDIPRLLSTALAKTKADTYSNAEYYNDERRASLAKFGNYTRYRGHTAYVGHQPLQVAPSFFAKYKMSYNTIIYMGDGDTPYTPYSDAKIPPLTIAGPIAYFGDAYFEGKNTTSLTIYNFVKQERAVLKIHSRTSQYVEVPTDDFYDLSAKWKSALIVLLKGRIELILRASSQLKAGEIAVSPELYKELGNVAIIDVAYALRENINSVGFIIAEANTSQTVYTSSVNESETCVVYGYSESAPLKVVRDATIPTCVAVFSNVLGAKLGLHTGASINLTPPPRLISSCRVVLAQSRYPTSDTIEVGAAIFQNPLLDVAGRYLTCRLRSLAGVNGNYVLQFNPSLEPGQVGLQPEQLRNLSTSLGSTVELFTSELQDPVKIQVRMRSLFSRISTLYAAVRKSFTEYAVLTTGHTIQITSEGQIFDVDVIGILDKQGVELHASYMRSSKKNETREYLLEIIPVLQPTDTALDVPSYESSLEESSDEEEPDTAYSYRERSPVIIRDLPLVYETEYEAPEEYSDAGSDETFLSDAGSDDE